MQAKAKKRNIKITPRKLRLMVKMVKKMPPASAVAKLKFVNKKSARILHEAVKQAIANARNLKLDSSVLVFKEIIVDEGPKLKRRDKFHGARFDSGIIHKRMSHLKIVLEEKRNNKKNKYGTKN